MPKTASDEDHSPEAGEHQIGATRQVATVKTKAEATRVQAAA
jgi:hypothetical protein